MDSERGEGDHGPGMTGFGAHLVLFHDRDAELVAGVADFLAEGLAAGEGGVVVATAGHADAIGRALRAAGFDPAPLVVLDAGDTLDRILDGDHVAPTRFDELLAQALGEARKAATVPRLRVFGEMVSVLWDRGQVPLAMELEDRWNRALRSHPVAFTLLCGYRMPAIAEDPTAATRFLDACGLHSAVRRSGDDEPEAWRRFDDDVRDLPGARAFVRGTLGSWGCHALATEASLVVTELATNAVLHARTAFHVSLGRRPSGQGIRIAVHDGSEEAPAIRHYAPGAATGRGLHLIRALSSAWGVERFAGGKSVWVELSAP
jgi:hypothetical protein